jgi:hypothetical protein
LESEATQIITSANKLLDEIPTGMTGLRSRVRRILADAETVRKLIDRIMPETWDK